MRKNFLFIGLTLIAFLISNCKRSDIEFISNEESQSEDMSFSFDNNCSSSNSSVLVLDQPVYYTDVLCNSSEKAVNYKQPAFLSVWLSLVSSTIYSFSDKEHTYLLTSYFDNVPLLYKKEGQSLGKELANRMRGIHIEARYRFADNIDGKSDLIIQFYISESDGTFFLVDSKQEYVYYSEPNALDCESFKTIVLFLYEEYGDHYV